MTDKLKKILADPLPRGDYKPRLQVLAPSFREPDPPAPFKFQASNGLWLNVRPETRNGSTYWYANKQYQGKRFNVYVSPIGKLNRSALEDAANVITG